MNLIRKVRLWLALPARRKSKARQQPSGRTTSSSRVYTIVHVDDHKSFLNGIKDTVRRISPQFRFISFEKPSEAREFLSNLKDDGPKIDCVLTGFLQPGIRGDEFARAIREMPGRAVRDTSIIMLSMLVSSMKFQPKIEQWREEGLFDAFVCKSASGKTVVQAMRDAISRRRTVAGTGRDALREEQLS